MTDHLAENRKPAVHYKKANKVLGIDYVEEDLHRTGILRHIYGITGR